MNFDSTTFELGMRVTEFLCDAKDCEKEAAEAKRRMNHYDEELGNLISEFNKVVKLRKEAKAAYLDNLQLAGRFRKLADERNKAIDILKAASDS